MASKTSHSKTTGPSPILLSVIRTAWLCLLSGLIFYSNSAAARQPQSPSTVLSPTIQKTIVDWFPLDHEPLKELPPAVKNFEPVNKDQVEPLKDELWQAYRQSPTGLALRETLPAPLLLKAGDNPTQQPHELKTGDKTMPFYFIGKGNLDGPRPLFIALHGGGSAGGRAPTPHGWSVNTREWNTQASLAARVYPDDALYFVPRMADDNDGRWYYNYCQDAYDRIVRAAIAFHQVDPDRVYLIGISEGAYTAYRLGAFMADRWAGAGSMAGGEPLNNAPPPNMRNIAFRADIGENDTMFDRIGLNRRYGEALAQLKKEDPAGFNYLINVQPGRGHGIDYQPCPQWLLQHHRNPWPSRVTWQVIKVHGRRKAQFYWLALDQDPPQYPLAIDAILDRQTIRLTMEQETDNSRVQTSQVPLRIYLNDHMLDLDQPVTVILNGQQVFAARVPLKLDVMLKSLAERGDPRYLFPAEIAITPAGSQLSRMGKF